jgi:hypothetical protein
MITQLYDYTPIKRETVEGKRHYCTPDGGKVPSVTTILDATKPDEAKKALMEWKKRMGAAKAQEITTEAAGRGTRMHKWLENYVLNGTIEQPGSNPFSIQSHAMANSIISQGLCHVTEFWGVEVPLFYSGLYAGTTDCLGRWKGKPAILDFKQTNKPKKREWIGDYFLQLVAYSLAHNEMHQTDIETGVILMCSADNQYQEFVLEGADFEYYKHQWWDRVEQYYSSR